MIDQEVENLQSRYGKMSAVDAAAETSNITGTFTSEEKELEKKSTIAVKDIKGKVNLKKFVGAKVGDVLELKTKNLFNEEHKMLGALGLTKDDMKDGDFNVSFAIEEITEIELADLDQELFDKLFADGSVKTVTELRERIEKDAAGGSL